MSLIDLQGIEARTKLAKMVIKLFQLWEVSEEDQLKLLGYSPKSRFLLLRYKSGQPFANRKELLERVGLLLSIHKSLRLIFPHNKELVYEWSTTNNRHFGGKAPVEVMAQNLVELKSVSSYLKRQSLA